MGCTCTRTVSSCSPFFPCWLVCTVSLQKCSGVQLLIIHMLVCVIHKLLGYLLSVYTLLRGSELSTESYWGFTVGRKVCINLHTYMAIPSLICESEEWLVFVYECIHCIQDLHLLRGWLANQIINQNKYINCHLLCLSNCTACVFVFLCVSE